MSHRGFVVELLGVGDWPKTDGSEDTLITLEQWSDVEDAQSVLVDPIVIAFDISPDRRSSIVAAGLNEQGVLHIELISSGSGTGWVAARMRDLYERHDVEEVVCDGFGPSAAIARRIDDAGITVKRLDSGDYGKACGFFVDAVAERTLRHIGQLELHA